MASFLDAHANQGQWLLRIEDLDPPREVAGSAQQIITTLEKLGFEWDESVSYQSHRHELYADTVQMLLNRQLAYACKCSRKDIAQQQSGKTTQLRYPGNCRDRHLSAKKDRAIRALTHDEAVFLDDRLVGRISQNLLSEVGDFVIRRKDGLFAYQLAVVVDDAEQNMTHIVRGQDLLDSTPRQIHLQQLLGYKMPVYAHFPLVLDSQGNKYSKSSPHGMTLSPDINSLIQAWHFLKQTPAKRDEFENINDFWRWAVLQWDPQKLVTQDD